MEALQRLFAIDYEYTTARDQFRARIIYYLNIFIAMLFVGDALYRLLFWYEFSYESLHWVIESVFVIMAAGGSVLANRGHLNPAALVYVLGSMAVSILLMVLTSVYSPSLLALAITILFAGVLFDRWGGILVMVTAIIIVSVFAIVGRETFAATMQDYVLTVVWLFLFGGVQWALVGELGLFARRQEAVAASLDMVIQMTEDLTRAGQLSERMRDFGLMLQEAFDLHHVQIFLRDDRVPDTLRLRSATGLAAQHTLAQDRHVSVGEDSPVALSWRENRVITLRAGSQLHPFSDMLAGMKAQVLIPLSYGGQVLGVLDLQSMSHEVFSNQAVRVISAIACQFATLVYLDSLSTRIQSYETVQQRLYAHIEKMAQETARLRRQFTDVAWDQFFRERGTSILGYDLSGGQDETVAGSDLTPNMVATMQTGEVKVEHMDEGHLLTIPLIVRGRTLGVMEFHIARQGGLPERVVDLATTVVERLSLAMENARLLEQTQACAYRERHIGDITSRLQSAANMENLLATAAEEFNSALGGVRTHIRLQAVDRQTGDTTSARPAAHDEGEAS